MFPEITRDDVFRLETERLWLRWPRAADVEAMVELAGDPEVALKTARIPQPYEARDSEGFIMRARAENTAGRRPHPRPRAQAASPTTRSA